jgi:crotonobetainyl-CoA:carnitine CoA-transferase CaiB-like acyl-CoA transferase
MDSEGAAGDLKGPEWEEIFRLVGDLRALVALAADPAALEDFLVKSAHVNEMLATFIMSHTKTEIYQAAASRLVMMVPAQNAQDLVESRQLKALGYFIDVEHPELGMRLKYPGAPYYHISDAPWRVSRRAPLVGEHNREVYEGELELSSEQTATLKQDGII